MKIINPNNNKKLTKINNIYVDNGGNKFDIINHIPRFVSKNNYTDSFSYQWKRFAKTQIIRKDLSQKNNINSLRLFKETNWIKEKLKDINILEVGSGAGRFTKVILDETKANLYSVDLSNAVESNLLNNYKYINKRLKLFQSDINKLPFEDNSFDKVLCLGVLQHTNDFYNSLKSLISKLKPACELVIDFYPNNGFWTKIHAKYFFRIFFTKISHDKLLNIIEKNINWLIKLSNFFDNVNLYFLTRFLPVCDIKNSIPSGLDYETFKQWVILDTFDMFSAKYDKPQRINDVKRFLELNMIKITFCGYVKYQNMKALVIRGIKN